MTAASKAHSDMGAPSATAPKNWILWTGRVLSAIPVLMLLFSAAMKLSHAQPVVESWVGMFGWAEGMLVPIGLLEVACAVVYVIPRTAVLGAILVSCYLAAAFATHLRIADTGGGIAPVVLGLFAWGGLYLREERLRALLPLRS